MDAEARRAAEKNDVEYVVRVLRSPDADRSVFSRKDRSGVRPMHIAAEHGSLDFLRLLFDENLDDKVNDPDDDSRLPIHWAAWRGRHRVVEYLLSKNSKINEKTRTGWTPTHYAAFSGSLPTLEVLSDFGADACAGDETQQSPLKVAERFLQAGESKTSVVDFLTAKEATKEIVRLENEERFFLQTQRVVDEKNGEQIQLKNLDRLLESKHVVHSLGADTRAKLKKLLNEDDFEAKSRGTFFDARTVVVAAAVVVGTCATALGAYVAFSARSSAKER